MDTTTVPEFVTHVTEYARDAENAKRLAAERIARHIAEGTFEAGYDAAEIIGEPLAVANSFFRGTQTYQIPVRYFHSAA